MTKQEVQQRVLQDGKPLSLDKFEWDEKTGTFSSVENHLVLDFKGVDNLTIDCGYSCTINCGYSCTINCGYSCTINCGSSCTINCGYSCTINCGSSCTINCWYSCTINCWYSCTINPKGDECVVVRRDVYEVIELTKGKKIKLNEYGVKGYKVLVKKPKKVVLTMDEIAEKFGVPVGNLKIKK